MKRKNLFLRNKGGNYYPLFVSVNEQVDLSALAGIELGFFRSTEMIFGCLAWYCQHLANAKSREVKMLIDVDVHTAESTRCRPLINTDTLSIDKANMEKFLAVTGHSFEVIDIPVR